MNTNFTETQLNQALHELEHQAKCEQTFTKNDIKHLHNYIHNQKQLKTFTDYFNIYKDWYTTTLITKTYILYGQSIENMINLNCKLIQYHITNPYDRLHAKSLYELQKIIITDSDWSNFYNFWSERKNELLLETVLRKYRVARKKCEAS